MEDSSQTFITNGGGAGSDDGAPDAGAAYVFARNGSIWSHQAYLKPTVGEANDYFGSSVSISNDTIVVGAFGEDSNGSDAGAAYVFVRDGSSWWQQSTLRPSTLGPVIISAALSLSRTIRLWLVPMAMTRNGSDAGAAHVFVREGGGWNQHAFLTAFDAAPGDYFGRSVSISNDTIVVGAFGEDSNGSDAGAAYVFVRDGGAWNHQVSLHANDAASSDYFGTSVSISADTVVVGAYGNDDDGSESGSAYVFVRQRPFATPSNFVEIPAGSFTMGSPADEAGRQPYARKPSTR